MAATEEFIKKFGVEYYYSRIKDLPYIAPVYKYEFALMNPYVMYKYNDTRICIRPFGEKDQSEWRNEIDHNKGGYLGPIKDKILEIVT